MESSPNVTCKTAQCSPLLTSTPVDELPSVVDKLQRSHADIWLANKKRIKKLRIFAFSTNNSRKEDLRTSENIVSMRASPREVAYDNFFLPRISYRPRYLRYRPVKNEDI